MATDYTRGEMDVTSQRATFSSFMRMTVWFSGHTALIVLFLSLYFAAGTGFWTAWIASVVTGVLIGLALRMKAAWYVIVGLMGGAALLIAAAVGLGSALL